MGEGRFHAYCLVEAGNKRAAEHGLTNCKFREGDATKLQEISDKTFDVTMSIFGAMFAPKPFDVAKEMVRVQNSLAKIIMGNWIPRTSIPATFLRVTVVR